MNKFKTFIQAVKSENLELAISIVFPLLRAEERVNLMLIFLKDTQSSYTIGLKTLETVIEDFRKGNKSKSEVIVQIHTFSMSASFGSFRYLACDILQDLIHDNDPRNYIYSTRRVLGSRSDDSPKKKLLEVLAIAATKAWPEHKLFGALYG